MSQDYGIQALQGTRAWIGAAVGLLFVVAVGAALLVGTQRYLAGLDQLSTVAMDESITRAGRALRLLGLLIGTLTVGTAAYTARSSQKVVASRQLPPPGARVLGRPRVILGDRAIFWGRIGYLLAALLAAAGITFTVLLWHFVDLMMSGVGWV